MDHDDLLVARSLAVRYGAFRAIGDARLTLRPGQVVAVLGPNGAGKSTLLRALAGACPISHGSVLLGGLEISTWSPQRRLAAGLVLVPEDRGIFRTLTVLENLRLGTYKRPFTRATRREIEEVLRYFPILGPCLAGRADTLSGGEEQALALARGLLMQPRVLLLDEPSHGLSPTAAAEAFALLARLAAERQIAMVIVEQQVHQALAVASYAYILEAGSTVLEGPPHLLSRHARVKAAYLGAESLGGFP